MLIDAPAGQRRAEQRLGIIKPSGKFQRRQSQHASFSKRSSGTQACPETFQRKVAGAKRTTAVAQSLRNC